jgi:spore maturation protein CgeB
VTRSIVFVDTYYSSFLHTMALDEIPSASDSYEESRDRAIEFGFSTSGAYARNMRDRGWDAQVLIPNSLTLQSLWARENGLRPPWSRGWRYGAHLARLPIIQSALHLVPHVHGVLIEQIKRIAPEVVHVHDLNLFPPGVTREIKKYTKLLTGEIASPLPPKAFLLPYDLIVSALPSFVETIRGFGIASTGVGLGFDERWATFSKASGRPIDAVFIGSFSRLQPQTVPLLQAVARQVPGLRIYGPAAPAALEEAGLAAHYYGQAWGKDMFELLGQSKMVINRHGAIAGRYAVNMRMYESTGAGAALITEEKSNLPELFKPGVEVVTYSSLEDAATVAAALLADPDRLDRVAKAGQARTLAEHSYAHRAEQLVEAIDDRLEALGLNT